MIPLYLQEGGQRLLERSPKSSDGIRDGVITCVVRIAVDANDDGKWCEREAAVCITHVTERREIELMIARVCRLILYIVTVQRRVGVGRSKQPSVTDVQWRAYELPLLDCDCDKSGLQIQ